MIAAPVAEQQWAAAAAAVVAVAIDSSDSSDGGEGSGERARWFTCFLVWPGALLSGRPAQTGFRWFGRLHAALSFAIPGQVGIASGLLDMGLAG